MSCLRFSRTKVYGANSLKARCPNGCGPSMSSAIFFESLGAFVRHGIIDKEIALSLWSAVVMRSWEDLSPTLAIMRRTGGASLWEQFEYLASISKAWLDRHSDGDYPPGAEHMPIVDVWLEADKATSRT